MAVLKGHPWVNRYEVPSGSSYRNRSRIEQVHIGRQGYRAQHLKGTYIEDIDAGRQAGRIYRIVKGCSDARDHNVVVRHKSSPTCSIASTAFHLGAAQAADEGSREAHVWVVAHRRVVIHRQSIPERYLWRWKAERQQELTTIPRKVAGMTPHDLGSPLEDPVVKVNQYISGQL